MFIFVQNNIYMWFPLLFDTYAYFWWLPPCPRKKPLDLHSIVCFTCVSNFMSTHTIHTKLSLTEDEVEEAKMIMMQMTTLGVWRGRLPSRSFSCFSLSYPLTLPFQNTDIFHFDAT
mmetsp:Transcript_16272/g.31542  ORF Transcript_16272/g.31542 Transcript_16272/m.31542 type:complete len:116 (+) Transcript_16272:2884-3231(+)